VRKDAKRLLQLVIFHNLYFSRSSTLREAVPAPAATCWNCVMVHTVRGSTLMVLLSAARTVLSFDVLGKEDCYHSSDSTVLPRDCYHSTELGLLLESSNPHPLLPQPHFIPNSPLSLQNTAPPRLSLQNTAIPVQSPTGIFQSKASTKTSFPHPTP
jgi:hypothetical protein